MNVSTHLRLETLQTGITPAADTGARSPPRADCIRLDPASLDPEGLCSAPNIVPVSTADPPSRRKVSRDDALFARTMLDADENRVFTESVCDASGPAPEEDPPMGTRAIGSRRLGGVAPAAFGHIRRAKSS